MGQFEIAQSILKKFPNLIQISTIEKFLPFHAACSQGHLDILKLLLDYRDNNEKEEQDEEHVLENIFVDPVSGFRYLSTFDLNALDVNDQSGLLVAVQANRFQICDYLLNLKVKKLTRKDLKQHEENLRRKEAKIPHENTSIFNISSILSAVNSNSSSSPQPQSQTSFFNQLKSVLLDSSSTLNENINLTINYTKNEDNSMREKDDHDEKDDETDQQDEPAYFNPISLNLYSKFGTTCLHEAVRNRNFILVQLLVQKGANVNLPTYEQAKQLVKSNCLCDALKSNDEHIFFFLLGYFVFNDENCALLLKTCQEILNSMNENKSLAKKCLSFLLKFKIINDTEQKLLLNNMNLNGCILNWNSLEPKLERLYESFLLNSINFKLDNFGKINKKLHLQCITRIDLSNNSLIELPFALFQIESLRYLKLSNNRLKKLPTGKSKLFDDVNILLIKNENLLWSCNQLEELECDMNELSELPAQLFLIRSLKHLNVSHNQLEKLPIEMWQAQSLLDMNASHNQLKNLPICSCDYFIIKQHTFHMNRNVKQSVGRSRAYTSPAPANHQTQRANRKEDNDTSTPKEIKKNVDKTAERVHFKEKSVIRANIWQGYSMNTTAAGLNDNFLVENDDENPPSLINNNPNEDLMKNNVKSRRSKLIELNLASNRFEKIPECLSCLAPKLIKLNMSSNKIRAMGAVCDLPKHLKFFDLSNNFIRRPMHLINENLLKFIIYYYSKYTSKGASGGGGMNDDQSLLNNNQLMSLLLENDLCYFNLVMKSLNKSSKVLTLNRVNTNDPSDSSRRVSNQLFVPRSNAAKISSTSSSSSVSQSQQKRRTRSQSRSARSILITSPLNDSNQLNGGVNNQSQNLNMLQNRRVLPFDLFLINLRYNLSYIQIGSNNNKDSKEIQSLIDDLNSCLKESDDFDYLERKEKLLINNQNIQVFLEQLCPHKRHIKLENLKSLNLAQNKLKKFNFMFELNAQQFTIEDLENNLHLKRK